MCDTTISTTLTFRETAFLIALPNYSGLGFQLHSYPVLIGAFYLGQYVGVRLRRRMMTRWEGSSSGCLVMEVWRRTFRD